MAAPDPAVEVPTTYYKHEQSVPIPRPAEEWRRHYQSEKKKLSESWLQQLQWNAPIEGFEHGPESRRTRKLHPFEAAKIKTNSLWDHWDSILQITGLRPGIDLKNVTVNLSKCRMMNYPYNCSIYRNCKRKLSIALKTIGAASWADNFDRIIELPNQTELEAIRILGESNQKTPRLGHFPSVIYKDLKTLGLAGMPADDHTNETALLCWRASLRKVGAKMGYHSLDKLKEDNNRPVPTRNQVVIDLDSYCQQQDERRGRLDALVADDRDQEKLKPKLEKSDAGRMKIKLEKSDADTVEMELEKSSTDNVASEIEKGKADSVQVELEKGDTILQSVEVTYDKRKENTGLQHGKNSGDRGQQPSKTGDWGRRQHDKNTGYRGQQPSQAGDSDHQQYDKNTRDDGQQPPSVSDRGRHHADIHLELDLSDSSSTEGSDSDDLVKRQDDILKYQETRIRRLESIIKKRKAKASQKGAKHKAMTERLQKRIKELSDKNSALEQALGNR